MLNYCCSLPFLSALALMPMGVGCASGGDNDSSDERDDDTLTIGVDGEEQGERESCGNVPFVAHGDNDWVPPVNTGVMTITSAEGERQLVGMHCEALTNKEGEVFDYVATFGDVLPEPELTFTIFIYREYGGDGEYSDVVLQESNWYGTGVVRNYGFSSKGMDVTITNGGITGSGVGEDFTVEWSCDPSSVTSPEPREIPSVPEPGTAHMYSEWSQDLVIIPDIFCQQTGDSGIRVFTPDSAVHSVSAWFDGESNSELLNLEYHHVTSENDYGEYELDCSGDGAGSWFGGGPSYPEFHFTCPETN